MTRLYDLDRLRGWTTLPTSASRWWAVQRWIEDYPTSDLVGLSRLLHDEDTDVVSMVAAHLGTSGDARWVAVLRRLLTNARLRAREEGGRARVRALFWGLLHDERGRQAVLDDGIPEDEPVEWCGIAKAMGPAQPPELRARLRRERAAAIQDDRAQFIIWAEAVLKGGALEDFLEVALAWRSVTHHASDILWDSAIAGWCGGWAGETVFRRHSRRATLAAMLPAHLAATLHHEVPALDEAERQGTLPFLQEVHRAVVRLLKARGDQVDAWVTLRRGLARDDYRTLAVGVEAMTRALALEAPPVGREMEYARASFALLCRLADRVDEVRWIGERGVWGLLRVPYDRTIPAPVVAAVVADRSDAVGHLCAALDDVALHPVAAARIGDLAVALHRDGVDVSSLIPRLAARLTKGDDHGRTSRDVAACLVKLGPSVDVHVANRLQGAVDEVDDAVLEVLSRLSTEVSLQALLGWWEQHPGDERTFRALANVNDARSLAAIEGAWTPGDKIKSGWLATLSEFVAPDHPMRPHWIRSDGYASWGTVREVVEDA